MPIRSADAAALDPHREISQFTRSVWEQRDGWDPLSYRDVEARMGKALEPFRVEVNLLMTIPGVKRTTAETIAAEIGFDMTRFPTAGHLVSWAGLCPRMDESAGKRRSTRIRPSPQWLKPMLVQAAWVLRTCCRTADARPLQLWAAEIEKRRGSRIATVALARKLAGILFALWRDGTTYSAR